MLSKNLSLSTKQHIASAYTLEDGKTLTLRDTLKLCEGRGTSRWSGSQASRSEGRDNIWNTDLS